MKALFFFIALFWSMIAHAGPFGTAMGDKPEKYGLDPKKDYGEVTSSMIPEPHSHFLTYGLFFNSDGLCIVGAVAPGNPYGSLEEQDTDVARKMRDELYDSLYKAMSKRYGEPWDDYLGAVAWINGLPDDLAKISLSKCDGMYDIPYNTCLNFEYKNAKSYHDAKYKKFKDSYESLKKKDEKAIFGE